MRLPILRLNSTKVKKNIEKMVKKASHLDLDFRPHFKTHQSYTVGQWFKDQGVTGITVSSLAMAEHFAADGWDDITVAFPASILDVDRINKLASTIQLKMLAVDSTTLGRLDAELTSRISVYIEIDPNYGRSGITISNYDSIQDLINQINSSNFIQFEGFYAHAGHSYKKKGKDEIKELTIPLIGELSKLKDRFNGNICWGDTPSCSVLEEFGKVDQLSPGNFVFYDWMQSKIGSCGKDEIAVTMHCPIVAKYDDRKELLIHGGAVHFSKDFVVNDDGSQNFGQIINPQDENDTQNFLKSVSQEHGLVHCSEKYYNSVQTGDIIEIYPIHSCLTADLMQAYISETGEIIDHFSSGAPFVG
jgi:D-serine deaminase-like pyridoxal phosphate-dependent protein